MELLNGTTRDQERMAFVRPYQLTRWPPLVLIGRLTRSPSLNGATSTPRSDTVDGHQLGSLESASAIAGSQFGRSGSLKITIGGEEEYGICIVRNSIVGK